MLVLPLVAIVVPALLVGWLLLLLAAQRRKRKPAPSPQEST